MRKLHVEFFPRNYDLQRWIWKSLHGWESLWKRGKKKDESFGHLDQLL